MASWQVVIGRAALWYHTSIQITTTTSSNVLLLFFIYSRFSKRFELPLLVQSIVMNLTMFLMIHLCVKVKRANAIMKTRDRVFTGMPLAPQTNHIIVMTPSKVFVPIQPTTTNQQAKNRMIEFVPKASSVCSVCSPPQFPRSPLSIWLVCATCCFGKPQ